MKGQRLKILYLITCLGVGGAEKLLVSFLKRINRDKYDPIVCCFYGGPLMKEIQELGIQVFDLKIKSKFNPFLVLKLFSLIKKEKPDILHTHLFHPAILGRVIGRLSGVPVIISTQHHSSGFHGPVGIWLDRITSYLADKIIAVSAAARKFCVEEEGISEAKMQVVFNGVDITPRGTELGQELRKRLGVKEELLIGSVGRFVEIKGYSDFILAASKVIKEYPASKFMLLGYGPLRSKLINLAGELGIADKVVFPEPDIDANDFLGILDIYVLPSLTEGLSITLLEAMAKSKAVVVTNVGGNPEVVTDKETGLLVSARSPQELSRAIIFLLKNRDIVLRMGSAAGKMVEEKFSIGRMVQEVESIYDSFVPNVKKKR